MKKEYSQLEGKSSKSNINTQYINKDYVNKSRLNQNIAFKNKDINEFECRVIKKNYGGYTFNYIKYNGKMYARAGQISNILNIDIKKFYPYLDEYITIHYVNSTVSNAKFASFKSILKAMNKIQQVYYNEKIRIELVSKSIDYILKEKTCIKDSIPYWSLVLEHMMYNLGITESELENEWGIKSHDVELMSLGFSPSNSKTKQLLKEILI